MSSTSDGAIEDDSGRNGREDRDDLVHHHRLVSEVDHDSSPAMASVPSVS